MPAGGYRTPASPAPVSGPGALSQRTDGGQPIRDLPDARYGESADFVAQQQGAPLAQATGPSDVPMPRTGASITEPSVPAGPPAELTPLFAPTARPDEPVTAGSPLGAGPGPSPVGIMAQPGSLSDALGRYVAADPSGVLANVRDVLSARGM